MSKTIDKSDCRSYVNRNGPLPGRAEKQGMSIDTTLLCRYLQSLEQAAGDG